MGAVAGAVAALLAVVIALWSGWGDDPDRVASDEEVRLFPTLARWDERGDLIVPIHGWIYEPEPDSRVRRWALDAVQQHLKGGEDAQAAPGTLGKSPEADARLRARLALFLVDGERNKRVRVRVGRTVVRCAPSDAKGHFFGEARLDAHDPLARSLRERAPDTLRDIEVVVDDGRTVRGVSIVPRPTPPEASAPGKPGAPAGVAVVCDLDDTLKVSNVRSERALFTSTFREEWRAPEGMPALVRTIVDSTGATIHYLSAARWPLQAEYEAFLLGEGLPLGSFHMREFDFSLRDISFSREGAHGHKRDALAEIGAALPRHEFILVGDSAEADPDVYGEFARAHPGKVRAILIRLVDGDAPHDSRFVRAFEGVAPGRVVLFSAPPAFETIEALVTTPSGAGAE